MSESDPTAVDEIVEQLRRRVDERRRAGAYPPGLEDELDLHFRHIAVRGVRDRLARLEDAFAEVEARRGALDAARIAADSQRPGGALVHRTIARVVARQVDGVLTQVREYAEALSEAHRAVTLAYTDLTGRLDELRDRMVAAEGLDDAQPARLLADLAARLQVLEEAESRRRAVAWRAAGAEPAGVDGEGARYEGLAKRLGGRGPVLLLGAPWPARFFEQAGVTFEYEPGDPVGRLAGAEAGSVGGVMLAGVFERLAPSDHVALVAALERGLAPGAAVAVDVRNPGAVGRGEDTGAVSHPAYVGFLLGEAGFADLELDWHGGASDEPTEARLAASLFGARGCTIVAVRR